ncbi:MAG: hypothetical protein NTY38_15380 [Acidobacteria bacterium]|nr:hypothetical protein [Acidobacteriota bacterium]
MKTSLLLSVMMAGAMGMALAQGPYPRDRRGNQRYNDRGGYGGGYGGGYRGNVVDRVMGDLSQAGGSGWLDNHERKHIEHAQRDLSRFQEKMSQGRFDRGRLDSAIGNLQHVVNADRIDPRSRSRLARDLDDLRNFRDRGGSRNGYNGGRPY